MQFSVVVPTDGASPHMLPTIANAVPDAAAVIVVWTSPEEPVLPDWATVVCAGPEPRIQHWWNLGIAAAPTDVVVVINDDVQAPRGSLGRLAASLEPEGATLAMLTGARLTGWCYALNRTHGVLPDERLDWYFGDDLLLQHARQPPMGRGRGVVRHRDHSIRHKKFRPTRRDAYRRDRSVYLAIRGEGATPPPTPAR